MKSTVKIRGRKLIDFRLSGMIEYVLHLSPRDQWGGPFNGQSFRQKIFRELISLFRFDVIVETGTYRGATTEFLARQSRAIVHSVESNPRYFGFAQLRLRKLPNVKLHLDDSRRFLAQLRQDPTVSDARLFFYLDSHWHADLPLREEVEMIFESWPQAVIMIDDFQVPDDSGYRFDCYGDGNAISLDYFGQDSTWAFSPFFPSAPSTAETGCKSGCAVLIQSDSNHAVLTRAATLRRWLPGGQRRIG